jgi:predicted enzyme related to lactoylglutathione lyase
MTDEPTVFRPGGVTYMRIPAQRPGELAAFYEQIFGWSIRGSEDHTGYTDASGYLIGHFVTDQASTGEHGVRPYISVESVADALTQIRSCGGEVVVEPYAEGELTVATFRDPQGNVIGLWQA